MINFYKTPKNSALQPEKWRFIHEKEGYELKKGDRRCLRCHLYSIIRF